MKPTQPDKHGHFGPYGGMFVPETLMEPLNELTRVYHAVRKDPSSRRSCSTTCANMSGVRRRSILRSA